MALKFQPSSPIPTEGRPSAEVTDGRNRRSFTLDFKRQVINFYHAHAGNITLSAKMFGVDRKMVRSWVEQQDFFYPGSSSQMADSRRGQQDAPASNAIAPGGPFSGSSVSVPPKAPPVAPAFNGQRKRLDRTFSSGSSARYPELEKALSEWWFSQTSRGLDIKAKNLKEQALKFYQELYPNSSDQDFKASTGWLQRFVTRMENANLPTEQIRAAISSEGPSRMPTESSGFPPIKLPPKVAPQSRPAPPAAEFKMPSQPTPSTSGKREREEFRDSPMISNKRASFAQNDTFRQPYPSDVFANGGFVDPPSSAERERVSMEQQNLEAENFYKDCEKFVAYLDSVSKRLAEQNS